MGGFFLDAGGDGDDGLGRSLTLHMLLKVVRIGI